MNTSNISTCSKDIFAVIQVPQYDHFTCIRPSIISLRSDSTTLLVLSRMSQEPLVWIVLQCLTHTHLLDTALSRDGRENGYSKSLSFSRPNFIPFIWDKQNIWFVCDILQTVRLENVESSSAKNRIHNFFTTLQ